LLQSKEKYKGSKEKEAMANQVNMEKDGAVAIISFCNPPMNFISNQMLKEFYAELKRVKQDPSIRVLVLTGGMKDSFITHYDVSELLEYARNNKNLAKGGMIGARITTWLSGMIEKHTWLENLIINALSKRPAVDQGIFYWARCMELLDTMPKPVIAAISGLSLGGGCEISLCCDFRFMADNDQYKIGLPEVLVGIIPGGTGTPMRLPRIVGEAKALEILLTGALYTPKEAEAMGLIHKALPADELMAYVMELAHRLERGAPIAQAALRKSVRKGSRMAFPDARVLDLYLTNMAMFSEDAEAGMSKYVKITSKFDSLDLDLIMDSAESLRNGREVEFQNK
jgi:enoyl-CoA hydratase/carnithine racemase